MDLHNLSKYNIVVMWGAGKDADWYDNQFRVDYFVDKNQEIIGTQKSGIPVKNISDLCEDEKKGNKILVIISSSKYRNEIEKEIDEIGINADVTDLGIIRAIYSPENVSYALWGFDILIRDILMRGGYDVSKMSYIEVGACHPILGSNSYGAYVAGARGILVEPNPDLYIELNKYRDDKCIMTGVAARKGTLKYFRFDNQFRNTFDELEALDAQKKGFESIGTVELEVSTLTDILDNNDIDCENAFLSIQVMGLEYDVLCEFDINQYRFPLIALAIYDDKVKQLDLFKDYHVIAQVPKHVILVNDEIYKRIMI